MQQNAINLQILEIVQLQQLKVLASISTIKSLLLSGFLKIEAEVNRCFNLSKASC